MVIFPKVSQNFLFLSLLFYHLFQQLIFFHPPVHKPVHAKATGGHSNRCLFHNRNSSETDISQEALNFIIFNYSQRKLCRRGKKFYSGSKIPWPARDNHRSHQAYQVHLIKCIIGLLVLKAGSETANVMIGSENCIKE